MTTALYTDSTSPDDPIRLHFHPPSALQQGMFAPTTYSNDYVWPKQDRPQERLQNDMFFGDSESENVHMRMWPGIEQGMYRIQYLPSYGRN